MQQLQQQLYAVAKEYARQTAEVLGRDMRDVHFVGTDDEGRGTIDMCDFGDSTFLSLDEMQTIIDELPKWTERYGSREAVGDTVREWTDWWLADFPDSLEYPQQRVIHQLRPRINLRSWLMGLREPEPGSDLQQRWLTLKNETAMLETLIGEHGPDNTLADVLENLESDLFKVEVEKEERDREEWRRVMASPAGREFEESVKEQELF